MIALVAPSTNVVLALAVGLVTVAVLVWRAESLATHDLVVRRGNISFTSQTRVTWLVCTVALGVVGLMTAGVVIGDSPISAGDSIATALWDRGGEHDFVINTLRVPRVLVAVLAGAALAGSGAIFQSLIGNPLMSPDVIGINQGAAVVAVFILVVSNDVPVAVLPVGAFVGALVTAALIYLLAWRRGVSSARLIIVGIGINALLGSAITFMRIRYPIERVSSAARWQAGSLFGAGWSDVATLAVGVGLLGPLAFFLTRRLRVLQLGDDTAAGLGLSVERDRVLLLATGAGLAATAVAIVGPLGFVALLVPHMARLMVGNLTGGVLILTALLGAAMLLSADLLAQRLFAPTTLPAGVVTAALGGPYFLFLLYRYNRSL